MHPNEVSRVYSIIGGMLIDVRADRRITQITSTRMIDKKQLVFAVTGAILALSAAAGTLAFAQSSPATGSSPQKQPGVVGTVSAVDGNSITLTGRDGTSYAVDAGSASITKDMTVSVSDIKVGDTLMAEGSVNGTSVTATNIHDGKMPQGMDRGLSGMGRGIHGTVSTINGSTLTVTATNPKDSSSSVYTVDASGASVLKSDGTNKPATSTLSAVSVGDTVMVAGTVNGTSVTAKMIVDGAFKGHGGPGLGGPGAPPGETQSQ